MPGEHLEAQGRRVISGVDENGKSTIVIDELTVPRAAGGTRPAPSTSSR
jgi:hypothetical protein